MYATLSLLIRSLRVSSRQLRTYLIAFAAVGGMFWALVWSQQTKDFYGAPGLRFLDWIATINFFFISFAAASYFSSAITEEREEMTLGLLKMAGVNPVSILLGKSTPRMLMTLLLFTLQLPFVFMAVTLGGVTTLQVVAMYFAQVAYLVLAANLGLLSSVIFKRTNSASFMTGLLLILYFAVCPILAWGLSLYTGTNQAYSTLIESTIQPVLSAMSEWSVRERMGAVLATGFDAPLFAGIFSNDEAIIGMQVQTNIAAGAFFFGLSWLLFNKCTQNEVSEAPARSLSTTRRIPFLSAGRAWPIALTWKEFNFVTGGFVGMIFKWFSYVGLILCVYGFIYFVDNVNNRGLMAWKPDVIGNTIMILMLIVAGIEIPWMLSRRNAVAHSAVSGSFADSSTSDLLRESCWRSNRAASESCTLRVWCIAFTAGFHSYSRRLNDRTWRMV